MYLLIIAATILSVVVSIWFMVWVTKFFRDYKHESDGVTFSLIILFVGLVSDMANQAIFIFSGKTDFVIVGWSLTNLIIIILAMIKFHLVIHKENTRSD
jgi:hypothetical protein